MTKRVMFEIETDHADAKYRNATLQVSQNADGSWYAFGSPFGCGKDASTPARAIQRLVADHGCIAVKLVQLP
jgi:hypothetical protein